MILSGISDNFLIFVKQYLTNKLLDTHVAYKARTRSRACYEKLRALLSEVNWDEIYHQMIADKMFGSFNSNLASIYNDSLSYVTRRTRPLDIFKPCTNAELRELIKEKRSLAKISNAILLHMEINIELYVTELRN